MNRYPVGANPNTSANRNFSGAAPAASSGFPVMQSLGRGIPMMQNQAGAVRPMSSAVGPASAPRGLQPAPQQVLGRGQPLSARPASATPNATPSSISSTSVIPSSSTSSAAPPSNAAGPMSYAQNVIAGQQSAEVLLSSLIGGKAKQSQPDFSLQSDDFPALGSAAALGGQAVIGSSPPAAIGSSNSNSTSGDSSSSDVSSASSMFSAQTIGGTVGKEISRPKSSASSGSNRKEPDFNLSSSLSSYGLGGLLPIIRMSDPDLNALTLGTDLTSLGLNLNAQDVLYSSFGSPWSDTPIRKETDYTLPACYYIPPPTLKANHLAKFTVETLFYIFYNMPRDQMQVLAAKELYNRGWKYHKQMQLWFKTEQPTQSQGLASNANAGGLSYFDVSLWKTRPYQETNASRQLAMNFMTTEEALAL